MQFVAALIVADGLAAGRSAGDARPHELILQGLAEPIRIMAPVRDQSVDGRQGAAKGPRADVIAHPTGGDEKTDHSLDAIRDGVEPIRKQTQSNFKILVIAIHILDRK